MALTIGFEQLIMFVDNIARLPPSAGATFEIADNLLDHFEIAAGDVAPIGAKFLAYVKQCLAPTLKRKDIVVIDNLPAHKAVGIREAIEARGATLRYLPQYSPDLNPIEMPFSKLKASLRKAAERKWSL